MRRNNDYSQDPLEALRKRHENKTSNKSTNNIFAISIILLATVSIAGVAWYMYDSSQDLPEGEILVISADNEDIKTKPADPGGMIVDNMDKSIYDSIDIQAKNEDDKVTTLLPTAEEPLDKNVIILEEQSLTNTAAKDENAPEAVVLVEESVAVTNNNDKAVMPSETNKVIAPIATKSDEEYIKPIVKQDNLKKANDFIKKDKNSFYKVQVASFRSSSVAEREWIHLSKRFPKLIGSYQHYITAKEMEGKGIFYRLQIGPFEQEADARKACTKLKEVGQNCLLVKPGSKTQ